MNTSRLLTAPWLIVLLALSSPIFGQQKQKDCSERSCNATFENVLKDDACRFLEAVINNEPEIISGAIANFARGCTNWEFHCEAENDRRRCTAQVNSSRIAEVESGSSQGINGDGCKEVGTVQADDTCSQTKAVLPDGCFSQHPGACKSDAKCNDSRGLFGSFSAFCPAQIEAGCGNPQGAMDAIRSAAYSNYGQYFAMAKGAVEGAVAPLTDEQKTSILSHITGIEMYSPNPGLQCYETYLEGAIDWSAGAVSSSGEGTEILVRAELDGYESADQVWVMPDASPSTIIVSGTVKDEAGKPIPNVFVSLPDLGVTITTNVAGQYLLNAEADGTEPFTGSWNFVLTKKVSRIEIEITPPAKPLAAPTNAAVAQPLTIKLLDCTDRQGQGTCVPLESGRVELEVVNADVFPFVQIQGGSGEVDGTGSLQAVIGISKIDGSTIDLERLWQPNADGSTPPLAVEIQARAYLEDSASPKKEKSISIPLDLMMIKGTTVDAILLPRTETEAPLLRTSPKSWVTSQLSAEQDGVFYVLIQPSIVKGDPVLMWRNTCNLQMNLPFSYLTEVRGLQPKYEAGAMLDVGILDLLTPAEHEFRLRQWVREFLHALGFDNGQLGWAISSLAVLDVQYDVPDLSVPRYGMSPGMESMVGMAGVIQVGEGDHSYWGSTAFSDLEDTSYAIFLHELGHYVHKKIGDRWIEACLWDKKFAGIGEHSTWTTPNAQKLVSVERAKMMTSFFEGTADFFAYSMFKFIEATHPEMKDSLYTQRGYLKEFETADKAMAAMHLGGCRVEGIQTSFFRELYDPYLATQPARAFGDLLRMMDAFKKESWIMRWVPARTIAEWASMKKKHGGLPSSSNLDGLIKKYTISACEAGVMAVPADPKSKPRITIDGRPVTLERQNLIQSLAFGQTVTVEQGMITVIVQVWDSNNPTTSFAAGPGTTFKILTPDSVSDEKGTLVVDGKITIQIEGGTITPSGTSYMVTVTEDGSAQTKVIDGVVSIETRRGKTQFAQGQIAGISRRGRVARMGNFDTKAMKATYITPVPIGPSPEPPTPAPAATKPKTQQAASPQAVAPSGLTFFAVRQKASGQCVVVAGTEGISAGDTIFGSFPTYAEAQVAMIESCQGGGTATPVTPPGQTQQSTPTSVESGSEFVAPVLALPKYDNDDSTKGIFFFNLDTGNAFFIDKVKTSPLSVRSRTLNQNIFRALGRKRGSPAGPGEIQLGEIRGSDGNVKGIMLVDSSTGAVAHITGLESKSYSGRLQPVTAKPAQGLATNDGNYALIMRRDGSGRTDGAYLYHGTTGKAIYFADIHKMKASQSVRATTPLPKMDGRISALALESGSEATTGILVIDNESGNVFHVGDLEKHPERLTSTPNKINLLSTFPASPDVRTPQRFVLIPVTSGSGATDEVLIVDVGSGQMAVLRDVRKPDKMRIQRSNQSIYRYLPKNVSRPRVIAAVPKVKGTGATEGAWLFDSASGEVLFLDNLDNLIRLSIHRVDQRAR